MCCKEPELKEVSMEAKKYIGKVLPDGHLSLPEDVAKFAGQVFEVILIPVDQAEISAFAEQLAEEKGFSHYTEADIEKIIHESRGIKE